MAGCSYPAKAAPPNPPAAARAEDAPEPRFALSFPMFRRIGLCATRWRAHVCRRGGGTFAFSLAHTPPTTEIGRLSPLSPRSARGVVSARTNVHVAKLVTSVKRCFDAPLETPTDTAPRRTAPRAPRDVDLARDVLRRRRDPPRVRRVARAPRRRQTRGRLRARHLRREAERPWHARACPSACPRRRCCLRGRRRFPTRRACRASSRRLR